MRRDDPEVAPDVTGEGAVTCPCGGFTFGPVWTTTPPMFARATCPFCGALIEPFPEELR